MIIIVCFILRFFHLDRKSTRLNSSHRCISYAVFCLKKKKQQHDAPPRPSPPLTYATPPPVPRAPTPRRRLHHLSPASPTYRASTPHGALDRQFLAICPPGDTNHAIQISYRYQLCMWPKRVVAYRSLRPWQHV